MKKINMNRLAATLLVLVLLTSCFVGSTMARYATGTSANDTARAAKFGVTISGHSDVFGEDYLRTGPNGDIVGTGELTVSSSVDGVNVVAPGTKGVDVLSFTISGSTEVAVDVKITVNSDGEDVEMIKLPKKDDYVDYTNYSMSTSSNGTFDQESDYYPIKWTLTKTESTDSANDFTLSGNLNDIEEKLKSLSKEYAPNSAEFASICGTYTLSWVWPIGEEEANPEDTYIGMVAAGVKADDTVDTVEKINFSLSIVQVD